IHFFDLLLWLFGGLVDCRVHHTDSRRMAGFLELERARVTWLLSVEAKDLPFTPEPGKRTTHRSIIVDGTEVEFSEGFGDLHTRVYEAVLAGDGFGIDTARPSIELVHRLRTSEVSPIDETAHDLLRGRVRRIA